MILNKYIKDAEKTDCNINKKRAKEIESNLNKDIPYYKDSKIEIINLQLQNEGKLENFRRNELLRI